MKQLHTYSILLIFLLTCLTESYSQFNNNNFNRSNSYITAEFKNENIIIKPETTFFNVLFIENKGEQREEVFIDINVPVGWSVIALEDRSYHINPGDTLLLPIRAAPARGVEGNIGYSLIAAVNNRDGDTYTNAYCFVQIERQSDLQFRAITRMGYFDQQTGESELSFRLINRGNISELVYLSFQSTENVAIVNERDNIYSMDVMLSARSDTTITLPVKVVEDHNLHNGSLFRIDLKGHTIDREFGTSFWFNHTVSQYKYNIPESEKILIAEIAAQNLFSDQNTIFSGGVRGVLLLPESRDFKYRFYRHGGAPSSDFLRYSRARVSYNSPFMGITVGDISAYNLKYGGGKGTEIVYRMPGAFQVSAMANRNTFRPITNYGISINERLSSVRLGTELAYTENEILNNYAYLGTLRGSARLGRNHYIKTTAGISSVHYMHNESTNLGYGLLFDYSGRIGNARIRIREHLGTPEYYGRYSGRHNLTTTVLYPFESGLQLYFSGFDQRYRPLVETHEGITSDRFLDNRSANLILRKFLDQGFLIYGGPVYQGKSTNSFFLFDGENPFTTHSAKFTLGTRLNEGGLSFNPAVTMGYTFITDHSIPEPGTLRHDIRNSDGKFFNSLFTLNLRSSWWGAFINYYYGPYTVNQEISQFYYDISAHSVRLMPYLERFIYKDIVFLSSKLSFTYDFAFKTSRINLMNQLDVYFEHDFKFSLLNTYGYQLTTDLVTDQKYTYSHLYFEARLTKEFNFNQPRIRYYDLKISLFKDLNGNLIRDPNEPGVRDILVSIKSIDPHKYKDYDVDYPPPDKLVSMSLLSGMDGTVTYENLPMGIYKIELTNVGRDQDKYFPDESSFIVHVTRDKTVYVPYLERNKIFGRVIMNRSRLSTLGRIELGNIKVTAVDSKGRETATLTDSRGHFEMYVPSIDYYVVSIRDIFSDHFNLRQNHFRANLNGFKQFEVNFVFDEIRRHVEFTPTPSDIEAEIRRVGRTNLSGIVRDASTLRPLRAQIEVVDNKTGNSITQTISDRANGRYSASFVTGEDYMLIANVSGYWMHSERLSLDQFLTIQDIEVDILMESIAVGSRFQLNNLHFAPESAEIPTEAFPELDRLIKQLKDNPNVRIRIEGHSDAVETLEDRTLSLSRADAVMRYMVQNGFGNIEYTGREDSQPVAPNDTEENRRRNRRVEIIIVDR